MNACPFLLFFGVLEDTLKLLKMCGLTHLRTRGLYKGNRVQAPSSPYPRILGSLTAYARIRTRTVERFASCLKLRQCSKFAKKCVHLENKYEEKAGNIECSLQ